MFHHSPAISPLADRLARADRLVYQIGYGSVVGLELPVPEEDAAETAEMAASFQAERANFE